MTVLYKVSQAAYLKLVFHALKYPSQAVNGVLVGKGVGAGSGSAPGSPRGDAVVEVVDAVPLFHTGLASAAMLEVALSQVDSHYAKKGLGIVGYYHGNERHDDKDLGVTAKRIADKIQGNFGDSCLLLLDNTALASALNGTASGIPVQLYTKETTGWKNAGLSPINPPEVRLMEGTAGGVLKDMVAEGRQYRLVDFDEHLEDISRDWLNPELLG